MSTTGKAGVIGPGPVGDGMQVADERLDVVDERPLARRATVAEVVGGVDDGAEPDEHRRHVLVAAGVLAVAVGEQGDESRVVARRPTS